MKAALYQAAELPYTATLTNQAAKICSCEERKCGCFRRFSDPDARIGWDSGEGRYLYGYSQYTLTARDPNSAVGLPVLIRFGEAHGCVSGFGGDTCSL